MAGNANKPGSPPHVSYADVARLSPPSCAIQPKFQTSIKTISTAFSLYLFEFPAPPDVDFIATRVKIPSK